MLIIIGSIITQITGNFKTNSSISCLLKKVPLFCRFSAFQLNACLKFVSRIKTLCFCASCIDVKISVENVENDYQSILFVDNASVYTFCIL